MKRMVLVVLALQGCALDSGEPEMSSDEQASTYLGNQWGLEIENGSIAGSVHRVTDLSTASNGAYLSFDGAGYVRYLWPGSSSSPIEHVWARVKAPIATSVLVQFDARAPITKTIDATAGWEWVQLGDEYSNTGDPRQLRLDFVQAGLSVDRILFSDYSSFTPITDTYEAESGSMVYPMRIGSQRLPPTTYAWAPTGSGSTGRIDLDVWVPTANASYQVWLRANAQSTTTNNVRVGYNVVYTSVAYDVPLTSTSGYTWSTTPTFGLPSTELLLTISEPESGVKIDKVLVTNDPGFRLLESSPPPVNSL